MNAYVRTPLNYDLNVSFNCLSPYSICTNEGMGVLLLLVKAIHKTKAEPGEGHKGGI